jgi:coenzyme PQQ precursor peptide PqqA
VVVGDENPFHSRIVALPVPSSNGAELSLTTQAQSGAAGWHRRRGGRLRQVDSLRLKRDWRGRLDRRHLTLSGRGERKPPDAIRRNMMRWAKPKIVEVRVGLEINSYACAEIA